ncbi:MAG TPA: glycoside hydrolase family 15 protein [Candidatus Binatia bacterium]|nr:glycoside hydrolase family 15 protein [Candidatus Binatia bacterium]
MGHFEPIENHGIIGDLNTVALVALDGSIDFFCFPRFDSPAVFASVLDDERGGYFKIAPELNGARRKQLYLPDSNILLTRFLAAEGVVEISDFMPVGASAPAHNLVRRVKSVRGEVPIRMTCAPRFNYGRSKHRCEAREKDIVFVSEGPDKTALRLCSSVPLTLENGDAVASFRLRADESAFFVLEDATKQLACHSDRYVPEAFKATLNFWRNWMSHCRYQGRWREMVNRSALTLKLLVSRPFGSLVAAPTFGLPEVMGGERNWDYRYTWIRDASFTIYALMRLGYTEEAGAFNGWIEQRCRELNPDGSLQIMYGIDGQHEISEQILTNLRGHRGSAPVRIGNAAYSQLQLDIHGELVDSVYLYDKWGRPISHDLWQDLVRLINWVARNWQQPDQGIWEVRGGPQEFLYSRVMCWVAIDRGIRLARKRSFPAPLGEWIRVRDTIYEDVFKNFWNEDLKAFVQYKGSSTLDAACLLMPLVKFISAIDPRWLSTLRAVNRVLVEDSLVHRYRIGVAAPDGLPGTEGTFCMCTFWLSECLARGGDVQQGRFTFEKMLGYANHLGLYAEELGAEGEHLGNFPQAFTHLSLISAAYALDRELQNAGRT